MALSGGEPAGEAEARERGDDEVEEIGGLAAVGHGIGQGADQWQELEEGAGPAVGED